MTRLLIFLLYVCTVSLHAADESNNSVTSEQVESALAQVQVDVSLPEVEREKLLASLRRTLTTLKSTAEFRAKSARFDDLRKNASAQAVQLRAELEKEIARKPTAIAQDISLSVLEHDNQQRKAELADARAALADVNSQIQLASSRANEIRSRQPQLHKIQAEIAEQLKQTPASNESLAENARNWQMRAESESAAAELKMLEDELLSQPVRLDLLKAQQDQLTHRVDFLVEKTNNGELFAIELRKREARKALSEAESAELEVAGKHPLILQLAENNTALGVQAANLAKLLEEARGSELTAREEADRFERDLETFQRKLQIVGMSTAMGQVLRERRMRLPDRKYSDASLAKREAQISASSLRQFEYDEQRRQLRDIQQFVNELTAGLPSDQASELEPDLIRLAKTRRDLLETVIEAESNYLNALGELDFTARRLLASADAYRNFISERLLWIRTSSSLSLSTFTEIPPEINRIFAPKQWFDLLAILPAHIFSSALLLFMLLVFAVLLRSRPRLIASLKKTGDCVGSVESDRLYYSFEALGLTILLAVLWPFLLYTLGYALSGLEEQSLPADALGHALKRVSYYFFGLEILRFLASSDGLARRHFLWSTSTLQPLARRLRALEQVFIPSAILAILAAQFYRTEGDSVLAMIMLIVAQVALALFFARMPPFMEAKLDNLLASGQGRRGGAWGKLVRHLLVLIPCLLILTMLLGFRATAVEFLVLLLLTITLFAVLLLVHEFGLRWLRLLRSRFIKAERDAALLAATEDIGTDEGEVFEGTLEEPDPDILDDDGRKLMAALLGIGAIFGVWAVWIDVLPALGILDNINLWNQTMVVNGEDVQVPVTLADACIALMVSFVGYVATKRVPAILEIALRQKMALSAGTVYAASTLFRYVLITLSVMIVLSLLGGSWTQIQWAVAALSVGIGFGLQEIVANFISGIILLFEQPIRVGDTVTVGDTSGVVARIRMRATTIRDWDRRELLVPNKEFITGRLLNWSLSDQVTRFVIVVGVAYGSNLKQAMELALQAARENPDVLDDPKPFITFDEFGDNSLQLVLRCYMGSIDRRIAAASEVRLAIDQKYREAGIVVAFPQRDVHLDTSVPLEINVRNLDDRGLPAQ